MIKTPRRARALTSRTVRAKTRREPTDQCRCGHARSEHKWGSKHCRHTTTTRTVAEFSYGVVESVDIVLCDCLGMS